MAPAAQLQEPRQALVHLHDPALHPPHPRTAAHPQDLVPPLLQLTPEPAPAQAQPQSLPLRARAKRVLSIQLDHPASHLPVQRHPADQYLAAHRSQVPHIASHPHQVDQRTVAHQSRALHTPSLLRRADQYTVARLSQAPHMVSQPHQVDQFTVPHRLQALLGHMLARLDHTSAETFIPPHRRTLNHGLQAPNLCLQPPSHTLEER